MANKQTGENTGQRLRPECCCCYVVVGVFLLLSLFCLGPRGASGEIGIALRNLLEFNEGSKVQSEADNRICSVLIWLSLVERDQDQERVQSSKRAPFVQLHLADTRT